MDRRKFIGIKTDETVEVIDFTGYKCLSGYVHGSYDVFHTMEFKNGYIDFMCNDACCTNESEEFKSINVFATGICKNLSLIYGDILLIYTNEDGACKGFTDEECKDIVSEFLRVINTDNFKAIVQDMHKKFDRS